MTGLDPRTTHADTTPMTHGEGTIPGGKPAGSTFDPWRYRDESAINGQDLVGYKVEAADGSIGKIDAAGHEVDAGYLVIDTGPWIFGKKVMLPAGVVNRVDHDEQKVHVDRTKEQIKAAPEYDEVSHTDPAYRDKLGGYYGGTYSAMPSDPPLR